MTARTLVVVGVESTGKTTLAQALARTLGWARVDEQARPWLATRDNRYQEADLAAIARRQWEAEATTRARAGDLVADTDLTVIRIWSEVRYGRCDDWILQRLAERPPAHYLLPRPDLPWTPDPQRETPDPMERQALHERYRQLLDELGHPWAEVAGQGEARLASALDAVAGFGLIDAPPVRG
ncbi:MAG: ATP-binding protein [Gammaproteobacteria bacterium]|nr:ATP-binding protein [Gammaproteobacteria bacterium]